MAYTFLFVSGNVRPVLSWASVRELVLLMSLPHLLPERSLDLALLLAQHPGREGGREGGSDATCVRVLLGWAVRSLSLGHITGSSVGHMGT